MPPTTPAPSHSTEPPGHFADRLCDAIARCGAPVCVGIDPVREHLPPSLLGCADPETDPTGFAAFSRGVVDAVAGIVPAVKFQSACFERYGDFGVRALVEGMAYARRRGMIVILDAKRGDIGISAEHYAWSAFGVGGADALTVNAYLGPDTLHPYLAHSGRGLFVLVRTSNPGSDAVQSATMADGRTVAEMMGSLVHTIGRARLGACGLSDIGAVVAATKPHDAMAMRACMPDALFLVPGFGAQGGRADDVRALVRQGQTPEHAGLLVTASRSVIYPMGADGDWIGAVRAAASAFAAEVATVFGR